MQPRAQPALKCKPVHTQDRLWSSFQLEREPQRDYTKRRKLTNEMTAIKNGTGFTFGHVLVDGSSFGATGSPNGFAHMQTVHLPMGEKYLHCNALSAEAQTKTMML